MTEQGPTNRLRTPAGRQERLKEIEGRHGPVAALNRSNSSDLSWFRFAEQRARRAGVPVADLLAHDRQLLQSSPYPSPDCLEPHEIEAHGLGELASERLAHARECAACGALLAACGPRPEDLAELRRELNAVRDASPAEAARQPVVARSPRRGYVLDAAAATIPVALAVGVLVVTRATPATPWLPLAGALAQVVLACFLAACAAGRVRRTAFWRHSGGALIGGVTVAVFTWVVVSRADDVRRRAVEAARALTEDRVAEIAASSLLERWRTGEFPTTGGQRSGSVRWSVTSEGHERAVYAATSVDLPGVAVADLRADRGLLCWRPQADVDGATTCEPRARLLVGTVTDAVAGRIVFKDANGKLYRLTAPDNAPRTPSDEPGVALVDVPARNLMAFYSATPAPAVPAAQP
jgi:hypothetical protein